MSSVEDLKKALGQRAKMLGNIVQSFENHNQVHFLSGYVAHKDDKLLLIEDVLDVLDDYVVVPRKQLEDHVKRFPDRGFCFSPKELEELLEASDSLSPKEVKDVAIARKELASGKCKTFKTADEMIVDLHEK